MDNLCAGRAPIAGGFSDRGKSISTGSLTGSDTESIILQQLQEVSKSVQDLGARLGAVPNGKEGQVQGIGLQLQQMKVEIFARLDSGVLMKKPPLPVTGSEPPKENLDQLAVLNQQTEYMKKLERSVNTLLDTSMKSTKEMKAISSTGVDREFTGPVLPEAKENVASQLESLQTVLMDELNMQKETLKLFKAQQDQLFCEFKQISQMPSPILTSSAAGATNVNPGQIRVIPTPGNGVTPTPFVSLPKEALEEMEQEANEQKRDEFYEEILLQTSEEEKDEDVDEEDVSETLLQLKECSGLGNVFSADNELESPPYHVEDFYWKTGINQKIARSNLFANVTVFVVVLNAVYIGFDSDYNNAQNIYKADLIFQTCSQFFCVYFTWELIVRFLAFKQKRKAVTDGWFKFDSFLVSTMILDTWVLMPTLLVIGGEVTIPTQPLRMLRLFKLTRMARLMKAFPELVTMIKGLVRSLRAISSSMILVGLMVYVWAIMMHMLMKEEQEYNDNLWRDFQLSFESMTRCIWTLLVSGTLMLDNASPLMSSLLFSDKLNYVLAGLAFVGYAMISAMCILQMLIGVLCDVVSTVKQEETNATAIGLMKQELLKHLKECDLSGDGKISQEELARVMCLPHAKALLRRLRINYPFFLELQKGAFSKPGKAVPIKDVLELMVMSRGDNVATVESMAGALVTIIDELSNVKHIIERDLTRVGHSLTEAIEQSRMSTVQGDVVQRFPSVGQPLFVTDTHSSV